MRPVSSILVAFGFLVAFTPVEAIFRPGYGGGRHRPPPPYHGGYPGGEENCETKKPSTTTTTTTTTTTPSTTTTAAPKCPDGFTKFARVPRAANNFTAEWCMKAFFQKDPIKIGFGHRLCTDGSQVTMFENDAERTFFGEQLKNALTSFGMESGSIAVDGARVPECFSMDRAVLDSEACSRSKSFVLYEGSTDPAYAWTIWAQNEPSANTWNPWKPDMENCVQFAYDPYSKNRTLLLNDFYCLMEVAPNDPTNTVYWNFGALCGVRPK